MTYRLPRMVSSMYYDGSMPLNVPLPSLRSLRYSFTDVFSPLSLSIGFTWLFGVVLDIMVKWRESLVFSSFS